MSRTPNSCLPSNGGHSYTEFNAPLYHKYYKHEGRQGRVRPGRNVSIAYQRLYCTKCGGTIEVVAQDCRGE
jgi:hypothetical protein